MRPRFRFVPLSILVAAFPLSACGNNSTMAIAGQAIKRAVFPPSEPDISRDSVRKIPYAMITARVGKGTPAILVLGYDDGMQQQWMATNSVSITTNHGRISGTVGFPEELLRKDIYGEDPLQHAPHRLAGQAQYRMSIETQGKHRKNRLYECVMEPRGPDTVSIVDLDFKTIRLNENCTGHDGTKLENTYWVDIYDGFVWQSRQRWHEGEPPVLISVLKPAKRLALAGHGPGK